MDEELPATGSEYNGEVWSHEAVRELTAELTALRAAMLELEGAFEEDLRQIPLPRRASAQNLLHYVALRRHDVRPLQEELVRRGLSSLGRCESYVLANVEAILEVLERISGATSPPAARPRAAVDFRQGPLRIEQATRDLFGSNPDHAGPSVMVTMPSSAAGDYTLVRDLIASGMDVMRINCAHDDRAAWSGMIRHLRAAETELQRSCRVAMDLAGPKIRTGEIEPGPCVARWQPARDSFGRVIAPARIWLSAAEGAAPPPTPADVCLPITGELLALAQPRDLLCFHDAAGRERRLQITAALGVGLWAESRQTTYATPGLELRLLPAQASTSTARTPVTGHIGPIAPAPSYLMLYKGDRLLLTDPRTLGRPTTRDDRGQLIHCAQIGCTLPEVFRDLRRGERVLLDDGKIGGVIEEIHEQHVVVEITRARRGGDKLRADKGLNLPDSDLKLPALTDRDVADLAFVVQYADLVSYSFVRRVDDVLRLQAELARLGRPDFPIVLKIENRQAFENLPRLLLAVMRNRAGVMIARGDLAVECGYERLAEIQEEILWMCEAAHLPVVWATQVLETLAKSGIPSRAEVTDAASAVRAECVMLNKGPFIVEAVRALEDILRRMQVHQVKKRPMLRKLRLAEKLLPLHTVAAVPGA